MKFLTLSILLIVTCSLQTECHYVPINTSSQVNVGSITAFPSYTRDSVNEFGDYLRALPLKPLNATVHCYDGSIKANKVHYRVVDVDVGYRDLQQCADAVMRLRAEFLYRHKRYKEIHFNFTNGFKCSYSEWMKGKRIKVEGNEVTWVQRSSASNTYRDFRKYMDVVFSYAGTLSLSKELVSVDISTITIGDVFIQGGSPGHAVIVLDVVSNDVGAKMIMLAQSYMPAQDIHILKSTNGTTSPWYTIPSNGTLETPEWVFSTTDLKRFKK
ncbi:DUF4846 domain-containing protein [Cyclobacteriaceae bacterium]|nr:DUF4846 domain-containing protein [Cyclobacteriaceae bacterium]